MEEVLINVYTFLLDHQFIEFGNISLKFVTDVWFLPLGMVIILKMPGWNNSIEWVDIVLRNYILPTSKNTRIQFTT